MCRRRHKSQKNASNVPMIKPANTGLIKEVSLGCVAAGWPKATLAMLAASMFTALASSSRSCDSCSRVVVMTDASYETWDTCVAKSAAAEASDAADSCLTRLQPQHASLGRGDLGTKCHLLGGNIPIRLMREDRRQSIGDGSGLPCAPRPARLDRIVRRTRTSLGGSGTRAVRDEATHRTLVVGGHAPSG